MSVERWWLPERPTAARWLAVKAAPVGGDGVVLCWPEQLTAAKVVDCGRAARRRAAAPARSR